MLYILICADESGSTTSLFVAQGSLAHLTQTVAEKLHQEFVPLPRAESPEDYTVRQRRALLTMLSQAPDTPGRHILPPIRPWYEQWTLWITDVPAASLDY